jgi:hypothetical protein
MAKREKPPVFHKVSGFKEQSAESMDGEVGRDSSSSEGVRRVDHSWMANPAPGAVHQGALSQLRAFGGGQRRPRRRLGELGDSVAEEAVTGCWHAGTEAQGRWTGQRVEQERA